jgi:hypothetical protein|tara:strand:+ start:115 stop:498 length:384 start_codon:yes stop_codon:yes gene_type:complete
MVRFGKLKELNMKKSTIIALSFILFSSYAFCQDENFYLSDLKANYEVLKTKIFISLSDEMVFEYDVSVPKWFRNNLYLFYYKKVRNNDGTTSLRCIRSEQYASNQLYKVKWYTDDEENDVYREEQGY